MIGEGSRHILSGIVTPRNVWSTLSVGNAGNENTLNLGREINESLQFTGT